MIPEIELPGHSLAALSAYPEYACSEGPFAAATTLGRLPRHLLSHRGDLRFPRRRPRRGARDLPQPLHPHRRRRGPEGPLAREPAGAGGDAARRAWRMRTSCRATSSAASSSYLLDQGRRLIGWDEILEGGLAPEATVMSWRGIEGGIEAARQGHDVIMTPTSSRLLRLLPGQGGVRAAGDRRVPAARTRLRIRAGAGRTLAGPGDPCPGRLRAMSGPSS